MRKFDILVPVVLIACLIVLAYILTQVFSESSGPTRRVDQSEIVLDPSRYTDEAPPPANVSNTPIEADPAIDTDANSSRLDDYYNDDETDSAAPDQTTEVVTPPSTDYMSETEKNTSTTGTTSSTNSSRGGKYLVIAGSFRQEIYAKDRVKNLRASGFKSTEMGYTNRGAYAVALVEALDSYSRAEQLAQQVRAKGYEVFIKTRK